MHPVFDFLCENCEEQFEEEMSLEDTENGHEMLCPECGAFTKKLLGGCTKHVSWSTWRVDLNQN